MLEMSIFMFSDTHKMNSKLCGLNCRSYTMHMFTLYIHTSIYLVNKLTI